MKLCKICGANFFPKDSRGLYCSRVCSNEARSQRDRKRRLPILEKLCVACGGLFKTARASQKFCCKACKIQVDKLKIKKIIRPPQRSKICTECRVSFIPSRIDQLYCSHKCCDKFNGRGRKDHGRKSYRKRARQFGSAYEPVDPIQVFERDLWRCQICGEKTPKRLRGKNLEKSPELDHRIALANGGSHTYKNVQCACRKCNRKKSAGRPLGQIPMFENPSAGL